MSNRSVTLVSAAYFVTLASYLIGRLFPDSRLWGLSIFAYFPPGIVAVVGGLGLAGYLLLRPWKETPGEVRPFDGRVYRIIASAATVVAVALFIVGRTGTHFLGDGYSLLGLLAADDPLIKGREIGEAMAHVWLKNGAGGDSRAAALLSFRIISIGAGLLATAGTLFASKHLFEDYRDRLVFAAGMLTGGYALLFFGYVENYSLFVLSVLAFTVVGMLISDGRLTKWYLLIPLLAAVLFHTLGVTLIPAAVYLLLSGTSVGRSFARARGLTWVVIGLLVVIGAGGALYSLVRTSYFVRLALLPLVPDRFTVDGYTLFSPAHLADYTSLLFLLLPGILVLAAAVWSRGDFRRIGGSTGLFLLVLSVSTLAAVFVFDPKLGMRRDWDLFSFAVVPVSALAYLMLLRGRSTRPGAGKVAWLAVLLGAIVLTGRLVVINDPPRAIAQFNDSIKRDHGRNRTARRVLIDYFEAAGDTAQADIEQARWARQYPIRDVYYNAFALASRRDFAAAIPVYQHVIRQYPNYSAAWSNLCGCFSEQQEYDSALFYCRVAVGMNPYDAFANKHLGLTLSRLGKKKEAKGPLEIAYESGRDHTQAAYNLAHVEKDLGDLGAYERLLKESAMQSDAPPGPAVELTTYYLARGRFSEAAGTLNLAHERGLDADRIRDVVRRFPPLRAQIARYPELRRIVADTLSGVE